MDFQYQMQVELITTLLLIKKIKIKISLPWGIETSGTWKG